MAKAGRKTKLTPKLQEKIVKYIEAGNYIKVACKAVGISERTYEMWNKKGLEIENKCFDDDSNKIKLEWQKLTEFEKTKFRFFRSIREAEARAEIRNVAMINIAAKKEWRAALQMLARKYHKRWGLKKQIGGIGDEPLPVPSITVVIDTKKQSLEVIDKEVKAIDIKSVDKKD